MPTGVGQVEEGEEEATPLARSIHSFPSDWSSAAPGFRFRNLQVEVPLSKPVPTFQPYQAASVVQVGWVSPAAG